MLLSFLPREKMSLEETLVGRYFVKCATSGLRVRILLAEMLFSVER